MIATLTGENFWLGKSLGRIVPSSRAYLGLALS
jgi:hypothetical protein